MFLEISGRMSEVILRVATYGVFPKEFVEKFLKKKNLERNFRRNRRKISGKNVWMIFKNPVRISNRILGEIWREIFRCISERIAGETSTEILGGISVAIHSHFSSIILRKFLQKALVKLLKGILVEFLQQSIRNKF